MVDTSGGFVVDINDEDLMHFDQDKSEFVYCNPTIGSPSEEDGTYKKMRLRRAIKLQ